MGLSGLFKENEYKKTIENLKNEIYEKATEHDKVVDDLKIQMSIQESEHFKAIEEVKRQFEKEIQSYNSEIEHLHSLISLVGEDKLNEIGVAEAKLNQLKKESDYINSKIQDGNKRIRELSDAISAKKRQIISLDDEIMVQSFGLYEPRYPFASSLDYKEALVRIRNTQKQLIKEGKAVEGNTKWTINGSEAKGQKMVRDTQKLILRAFNSECDTLIEKVKYNNFDASLNKLYSLAEIITKLTEGSTKIKITNAYIDAKVKELRLALEFQLKKQEEKEAIREAKAQEREYAKLQRELAEQRKKVEKEQNHYERALSDLRKQLIAFPENPDLLKKQEQLEASLSHIERSLSDIDYREANQKTGYVYVISNIGAFGENIYKIGMTRRLDPQERIDELGDASVPFKFDVHAMIFSDDAPALEAALHNAFKDKKVNMVNTRREFFNVTLDEIKTVIKNNYDKTVEFIDVADAEQYRISLRMKEQLNVH